MAKNFSELRAKMSPEARAQAHAIAQIVLADMETPLSVSELRAKVEEMSRELGGELEIGIRWPDGSYDTCDLTSLYPPQAQ